MLEWVLRDSVVTAWMLVTFVIGSCGRLSFEVRGWGVLVMTATVNW